MNKLTNRKSETINQKILDVLSVERNNIGEIKTLKVKVSRDDGTVTSEGTALDEKSLTSSIQTLISLYHESDEYKVNYDFNDLIIENTKIKDFTLPLKGYAFSNIDWEILEGSGIEINGDQAIVTRTYNEQTSKLRATITSNNISRTKDFTISIPRLKMTTLERLEQDANSIILPSRTDSDLTLPQIGKINKSNITWVLRTNEFGIATLINGYTLKVTRPEENTTITLVARLILENTSLEKSFDIIIEGTNTRFSPPNYTTSMVQIKGELNQKTFNVTSSNSNGLYLTKETEFSDELDIRFKNNGSTNVEVTIVEKEYLNNTIDIGSVDLEFTLKVYLNDDRNTLIGTLPCVVKYYFTTTSPVD